MRPSVRGLVFFDEIVSVCWRKSPGFVKFGENLFGKLIVIPETHSIHLLITLDARGTTN